jgi:hypothetical protein
VAAVELAFVIPLFALLMLGTVELGTAINTTTQMTSAVREAGRLAAMDLRDLVQPGQTANAKVEQDLRNFLAAAGLPADELVVSITHADGSNAGATFDLEDPENYMKLFRISASIPYSSISLFPIRYMADHNITTEIVFCRGRVTTTTSE